MEACVARVTIRNAGEFNGFLKPKVRLFSQPLCFVAGELVLPAGFRPTIDVGVLSAHEGACERFAPIAARGATQPAWSGEFSLRSSRQDHLSRRERSDRALTRDPGEGIKFTRSAVTPSPGMCARGAHIPTSPQRGEVK